MKQYVINRQSRSLAQQNIKYKIYSSPNKSFDEEAMFKSNMISPSGDHVIKSDVFILDTFLSVHV